MITAAIILVALAVAVTWVIAVRGGTYREIEQESAKVIENAALRMMQHHTDGRHQSYLTDGWCAERNILEVIVTGETEAVAAICAACGADRPLVEIGSVSLPDRQALAMREPNYVDGDLTEAEIVEIRAWGSVDPVRRSLAKYGSAWA